MLLKAMLALIFVLCMGALHAQDAGEQQQNLPTDTKAQRVLAKKEKQRKKQQEKATKAALKEHMKHQTPEVRKRMKADARRANRNNEHKGDGFFYKLFHHRKRNKAPAESKPAATTP